MESVNETVLEIKNVTKAYTNVLANNDISLTLNRGQVHALLGENGAGKSTLVKIIYGLVKPDSGIMTFNKQSYAPDNPQKARATGVGMVFQHFSLFDSLTVAQNITLGLDKAQSTSSLMDQIELISSLSLIHI